MISFIFVVKNREIKEDFLKSFNIFYGEKEIFFAIEEGTNLNIIPNPEIITHMAYFAKNTSQENMIQSLVQRVKGQTLVIVRDGVKPIIFEDLKNAIVKQREGNDVVLLKKEKNKFKAFFSKILKVCAEKMFGFKFYDSELTVQVLGENAIKIIKTNGTGILTKVNRWVGANIAYIDSDVEKINFKNKKQKKLKIMTLFSSLIFMLVLGGSIALGVIFSIPWLGVLGIFFLNIICFTIFIYNLMRLYTHYRVGDLTASKVEIIDFVEVKNDKQ